MTCKNEFDYLCELFEDAIPAEDAYIAHVRDRIRRDDPNGPAPVDLTEDDRMTDAERVELIRLENRIRRIGRVLHRDYRIQYNDQWSAWKTYRKYHPQEIAPVQS